MELVILRQLKEEGPDVIVVLPRHRIVKKKDVKPTGRNVAGSDEYVQGTPEQIERYINEHK